MTDTITSVSGLQTLFADNEVQAISPQDLRDFLVSAIGVMPPGTMSASGTLTDDQCFVDVTCGTVNVQVTLPGTATARGGKFFVLRKADGSAGGTLTANGVNINGSATKAITTQYSAIVLIKTTASWAAFTFSA